MIEMNIQILPQDPIHLIKKQGMAVRVKMASHDDRRRSPEQACLRVSSSPSINYEENADATFRTARHRAPSSFLQVTGHHENKVSATFIMILFKILQEKDPRIGVIAKQVCLFFQLKRLFYCFNYHSFSHFSIKKVVKQCTILNRRGHPDYVPLVDALRTNLYPVVGERHWNQTERCTRRLLSTVHQEDVMP